MVKRRKEGKMDREGSIEGGREKMKEKENGKCIYMGKENEKLRK